MHKEEGKNNKMESLLIRFTDSKFADSYRTGRLSFSSLHSFWDLHRTASDKQQDFSEGVALEVPSDIVADESGFGTHIGSKVMRARVEAYGYCKILCFYRVDVTDSLIQAIPDSRFSFGDTVIIVKDEKLFEERVIKAASKHGEACILGDVRYHNLKNMPQGHTVTVVSDEPFLQLSSIQKRGDKYYGCLDKYVYYREQREYRACWLPRIHDHQRKELDIGPGNDVFDIIPAVRLPNYLQHKYPCRYFGKIEERKLQCVGNVSYNRFMKKVERIDAACSVIFEIR